MKRTILLAAYGMALCLAVLSTAVSQTTGTLIGRVTDDHDTPLTRATVKVTGGPGAYTKSDGTFLLAGIKAGVVDVVIRYAGMKEYATQVSIVIDQTTTLNVKMAPTSGTTIMVVERRENRTEQVGSVQSFSPNSAAQGGSVALSSPKEIESSPRTPNVYQSVVLAGGVSQGGLGIRGGRTNESSFRVETLPDGGVQVTSSGFSGGYQDVLDGVINSVQITPTTTIESLPTAAADNTASAVPPVVAPAQYQPIYENEFIQTGNDRTSTFSIDVDAASYTLARRIIQGGGVPSVDGVRIEEMVNYFPYDYPQPEGAHPFSISTEISDCPWNREHRLIRIGLQGRRIAEQDLPPANLVFLIDVSGSMAYPDKLPLLKQSLKKMIAHLRPEDQVAIVVYAGRAGLVLPPTSGGNKKAILDALDQLGTGGSTAGGAGIKLAYEIARKNFKEGGNNRVMLATDGDFNVGVSGNKELIELIEKERESGVFLTVLGFGSGNYQDAKMEGLADHGNGAYAYIDNLLEGEKVLVREMGGTLTTIAKDVKIQIVFNPEQVESYRLIGYENRMLRTEDFDDDRKDAGEIGAGASVTALYEIMPGHGSYSATHRRNDTLDFPDVNWSTEEMMRARLRYKLPAEETSTLIEESVQGRGPRLEMASQEYRFAAAVAEFGLLLRNSRFKGEASAEGVLRLAGNACGADPHGYRKEFIELVTRYRQISP